MIHVSESLVIPAPPEAVYAVIADYRVAHKAVLPKPYFVDMRVEQGGTGAGTIAIADVNVMGVKQTYRLVVSEPQPGRVIEEVDEAAGVRTWFTFDPVDGGAQTRLTISSDTKPSPGFRGLMERLMNPPITRRIYREELALVAAYVAQRQTA
jgi:hypothetical protein